jgi:hypothetical protein
MNPFIGKNPNASIAQSVSELVAEGGNVLASDDAPTAAGQAPPLETTMPANTGRPTSQTPMEPISLAAPRRIPRRPGVQHRATLHLPSPLAFTKESKAAGPVAPRNVSYRPRARMTVGRVRPANGSS